MLKMHIFIYNNGKQSLFLNFLSKNMHSWLIEKLSKHKNVKFLNFTCFSHKQMITEYGDCKDCLELKDFVTEDRQNRDKVGFGWMFGKLHCQLFTGARKTATSCPNLICKKLHSHYIKHA